MSAPEDGGPAFPSQNGCSFAEGMSLRDWFAGMALQGYLSLGETAVCIAERRITSADTAQTCYCWADAMLAARERKENV